MKKVHIINTSIGLVNTFQHLQNRTTSDFTWKNIKLCKVFAFRRLPL